MLDLFILETCPYCKKVIDYMKENNIKFHKFDTINSDNVIRLLSIGGKDQVPFLYNEKFWTGINLCKTSTIIIKIFILI